MQKELDSKDLIDLVLVGFTIQTKLNLIEKARFVQLTTGKILDLPVRIFIDNIGKFRLSNKFMACFSGLDKFHKKAYGIGAMGYKLNVSNDYPKVIDSKYSMNLSLFDSNTNELLKYRETYSAIGEYREVKYPNDYYIVEYNDCSYFKIDTKTLKTKFISEPFMYSHERIVKNYVHTPYTEYPIEYISNDKKRCVLLETCWHNCNDFNNTPKLFELEDGLSCVGDKLYAVSQIRKETFIVPKDIKELIIHNHVYVAYLRNLVIKNPKLKISIAEQLDDYNPPAVMGNYINKNSNKYIKYRLNKVTVPSNVDYKVLKTGLFELLKFNYFSLDYYNRRDHKLHKLRLARNKDVLRDLLKNEFSIDLVEE